MQSIWLLKAHQNLPGYKIKGGGGGGRYTFRVHTGLYKSPLLKSAVTFIYSGFNVTFNTVQVMLRWVVLWAVETSTCIQLVKVLYYKLLTIGKKLPSFPHRAWGLNHRLEMGSECYHCATLALHTVTLKSDKQFNICYQLTNTV